MKRKIELGLSLEEQLRDDPRYAELTDAKLKDEVSSFEKKYLTPLDCVDRYLRQFGREGQYLTVSAGISDKEGRWQSFVDYSNTLSRYFQSEKKRLEYDIEEEDIGEIEEAAFDIIRLRSLPDLPKAHMIMRNLPKYCRTRDGKREIKKIARKVEPLLLPTECVDESKQPLTREEVDAKWATKNLQDIVYHLKKAVRSHEAQAEKETPLTLLEAAHKKLTHKDMDLSTMAVSDFEKARTLVVCPKNDFTFADLIEDGVNGSAPHERLRVCIVMGHVVFDGYHQFLHAAKDAAAKALLRQLAEPALDEVEPRGAGRREVQFKARVGGQPLANRFVLVGRVVVQDDVQGEVARERTVEVPQELQEFLVPMTAVALAEDLAGQHVQRGEQRRRAMPLVVVGHGTAPAWLHRQARLRAVQGLNLALLVHTKHHGFVRRVQVQPDDVGQLLDERRVFRQLERRDAVRLQAVRVPDALDGRAAHPGRLGHRAATPVGGARRRLVQRGMHDGLHLVGGDLRFPAAARTHLTHRIQSIGEKPRSPVQHRRPTDAERGRNATIRHAVTGHQQGLGAGHHAVRRGSTERPLRQRIPMVVTEQQRGSGIVHTRRYTTRRTNRQGILVTDH